MGFDRAALERAVTAQGRVARVVVADVRGSAPREVGAAMLVWDGQHGPEQSGTIGGGALELAAARAALQDGARRLTTHALGPELGQCCGGAVRLLTELFTMGTLPDFENGVFARPTDDASEMPLSVRRRLSAARARGLRPATELVEGWFIEPQAHPQRAIWIWGAGHVGRAIVGVLAGLPDISITWVDTAPERFPDDIPETVTAIPAARPADLAAHAPAGSEHLVLTYSHALDLALCHALLARGFADIGLIGSRTKWARFRNRLAALGHDEPRIDRITCPIGDPALGKHPQALAIGVAAELLRPRARHSLTERSRA